MRVVTDFVWSVGRKVLPRTAKRRIGTWIARYKHGRRFRGWQRSEIFAEIYSEQGWGKPLAAEDLFFSGHGSLPAVSRDYEELIADFVVSRGVRSITDVGCGDFQVARRILDRVGAEVTYTGVDIVPRLVERNAELFGSERVSFVLADAVEDPLPPADLVLVREVLQHLSNADVQAVVEKIRGFPFAIITNTNHKWPKSRNIDQPAGPWTRATVRSGLWLEDPPFNLPSRELMLIDHPTLDRDYVIRTVLHEQPRS